MNGMALWLFSIATFISTLLGGMFSMKFRQKLHLIMAFAAGVLIGVFSFEILPEIMKQAKENNYDPTGIMVAFAAGFIIFHILEKVILIHHAHEEEYADHKHPHVGMLSAFALIGHSFLDGVGIGLGFQVGNAVGTLVALAVISHDFTDGMNTVSLMLLHKNTLNKAKVVLLGDASAPVLGAFSTLLFQIPNYYLILYLAFFGGFLVYIGASDVLPEAHSKHSSFRMIGLTVLGLLTTFIVSTII
jgi:zinc and cadmium transporter